MSRGENCERSDFSRQLAPTASSLPFLKRLAARVTRQLSHVRICVEKRLTWELSMVDGDRVNSSFKPSFLWVLSRFSIYYLSS